MLPSRLRLRIVFEPAVSVADAEVSFREMWAELNGQFVLGKRCARLLLIVEHVAKADVCCGELGMMTNRSSVAFAGGIELPASSQQVAKVDVTFRESRLQRQGLAKCVFGLTRLREMAEG